MDEVAGHRTIVSQVFGQMMFVASMPTISQATEPEDGRRETGDDKANWLFDFVFRLPSSVYRLA